MSLTISPAKANHLFWLGRYAERVYTTLALLRGAWEKSLDGDAEALPECYHRIGAAPAGTPDEQLAAMLYDKNLPGSLNHSLECVFDNSVVLREELKTESLSYINLCRRSMVKAQDRNTINLTDFQKVSDYILAFWGAVSERVYNAPTLKLLYIGKHVEYLDLHIRFNFPFDRLRSSWNDLNSFLDMLSLLTDQGARNELTSFFLSGTSKSTCPPYVLQALNRILMV